MLGYIGVIDGQKIIEKPWDYPSKYDDKKYDCDLLDFMIGGRGIAIPKNAIKAIKVLEEG